MRMVWASQAITPAKCKPWHFEIADARSTTGAPGSTPARSMPVFTSMTTFSWTPFARAAASRRCNVLRVVHGNYYFSAGQQVDQPAYFRRTDYLIGDKYVSNAGSGHDLCFAQLGAGDADGAGVEQAVGDRRNFGAFYVWPPTDGVFAHRRGHSGDVAVHLLQIDQQRGRIECFFGHANGAYVRKHHSLQNRDGPSIANSLRLFTGILLGDDPKERIYVPKQPADLTNHLGGLERLDWVNVLE